MGFVTPDTVGLITGGSKGIGKALALEVLERGGRVCIVDIDEKEGKSTLREMHAKYGTDRAIFLPCNVVDEQQLASVFKECLKKFGRIDLVVNNAGIGDRTMITDAGAQGDAMPADWKAIVDVNLTAVINGTRLAYNAMRANPQPNGVIVNISSLGGFVGQPYSAVYAATKHGVIGHVRSLGYLRKNGVRVVGLSPGFTDTNLVSSGTKESPMFSTMIKQATKNSGGLMTTADIVEGAFILIDDPTKAGVVLSVSRELGFALHDTPMIYPKDSNGVAKTRALPHQTIRQLKARL